jgi:hypothetical protein
MRRRWLPASFVRFLWLCVALFVGLMVYVIGEAYAELYMQTLPHNNLETVVYVYGWVATVHLLDALTGWVLGIREGERVGSYPLSWVFKLYVVPKSCRMRNTSSPALCSHSFAWGIPAEALGL